MLYEILGAYGNLLVSFSSFIFITWQNLRFCQVCWSVGLFVCDSVCLSVCAPSSVHNFVSINSNFFHVIDLRHGTAPHYFGQNPDPLLDSKNPWKSRKSLSLTWGEFLKNHNSAKIQRIHLKLFVPSHIVILYQPTEIDPDPSPDPDAMTDLSYFWSQFSKIQ